MIIESLSLGRRSWQNESGSPFINGTFRDSYIPTIEDTYRKVCYIIHKSICTLQITDTTGSHHKGHAFILVYSIISRQSLEELRTILERINE
ncbi:GTP-binding protein Di-Ras1, partial [Caligus rogercresseyi]